MPLPSVFWAGTAIHSINVQAGPSLPSPQSQPLPYNNVRQIHSKWCWAAVAQGIKEYYTGQVAPQVSPGQCRIATDTLLRDSIINSTIDCCDANDAARFCYVEHRLESALQVVGHYSGPPAAVQGQSPWSSKLIAGEIMNGRVLGVRIDLSGGSPSGHFVVIHGYETDVGGNEYVDVADPDLPQLNSNRLRLWRLANAYRVIGTWDYVYLTQP
jgi:Papain-like cysteine protease AvrRpt2